MVSVRDRPVLCMFLTQESSQERRCGSQGLAGGREQTRRGWSGGPGDTLSSVC